MATSAIGVGAAAFGSLVAMLGAPFAVPLGAPLNTAWAPLGLFYATLGALAFLAGLGLWSGRAWGWWLAWSLASFVFLQGWPEGIIRESISLAALGGLLAISGAFPVRPVAPPASGERGVRRAKSALMRLGGVDPSAALLVTVVMIAGTILGEGAFVAATVDLVIVLPLVLAALVALALIARALGAGGGSRAPKA